MIINTINGDSNLHFFREFNRQGLTAAVTPVLSFSISESDFGSEVDLLIGHYSAWSYFPELPSEENALFVRNYRQAFGANAIINDPIVSTHIGIHLWFKAAREACSSEPQLVNTTILRQSLLAPQGIVSVDGRNRHLWQDLKIARYKKGNIHEIIWTSGYSIHPVRFPLFYTYSQWQQFIKENSR